MVRSDGYQVTLTVSVHRNKLKKGCALPNGPHADWQSMIGCLGIGFFLQLTSFNIRPIN